MPVVIKSCPASVERAEAEEVGLQYLRDYYEPTGDLEIPLVTAHNMLDPAVPFEHESIYAARVASNGKENPLAAFPVDGYGHCNFTTDQILGAFRVLVFKAAQNP